MLVPPTNQMRLELIKLINKRVDRLILKTPTGLLRNALCNAHIYLLNAEEEAMKLVMKGEKDRIEGTRDVVFRLTREPARTMSAVVMPKDIAHELLVALERPSTETFACYGWWDTAMCVGVLKKLNEVSSVEPASIKIILLRELLTTAISEVDSISFS